MSIAEIRRAVLRELIKTQFDGVARQLAIAAKKPEGQINDMLSSPPRKSFGEKVARQIEVELKLAPGYFDQPSNACADGRVTQLSAQQPTAPYLTATIAEIVAILERLSAAEQKEALGAVRYIEYECQQRQKNSIGRAGQ